MKIKGLSGRTGDVFKHTDHLRGEFFTASFGIGDQHGGELIAAETGTEFVFFQTFREHFGDLGKGIVAFGMPVDVIDAL